MAKNTVEETVIQNASEENTVSEDTVSEDTVSEDTVEVSEDTTSTETVKGPAVAGTVSTSEEEKTTKDLLTELAKSMNVHPKDAIRNPIKLVKDAWIIKQAGKPYPGFYTALTLLTSK